MTLVEFRDLVLQSFQSWSEDRAPSMGAAIAYYTMFSMAPTLVLVIAIAGFVFGEQAAEGAIAAQLADLMGRPGAAAVQAMIASASAAGSGRLATVISLLLLALAATTVFAELQASLNIIWRAAPSKRSAPVELVKTRLIGLSVIVAFGFLLLVSLIVSTALAAFADYLGRIFSQLDLIMRAVNFIISFGITTILFALVYKILPDTRIEWSDVWVASATAALLFGLGKFLISFYIGQSRIASTYGAASALVTILVWIYYSSQIVLFGAEFSKTYARMFGSRRRSRRKRPRHDGT